MGCNTKLTRELVHGTVTYSTCKEVISEKKLHDLDVGKDRRSRFINLLELTPQYANCKLVVREFRIDGNVNKLLGLEPLKTFLSSLIP